MKVKGHAADEDVLELLETPPGLLLQRTPPSDRFVEAGKGTEEEELLVPKDPGATGVAENDPEGTGVAGNAPGG